MKLWCSVMKIQAEKYINRIKRKPAAGPAGMELAQIIDEKTGTSKRMLLFELLLAIALSVGCWYTYFSMFPNPVDPVVSACLITGLPIGLYLLCWNPFLGRFLVFYVFLLTAVLFLLAYKPVWNGILVMGNIAVEVLNDEIGAGLVPFQVEGDTVDCTRDVFMALIPLMLLTSMAIVHSIYYKEPLLGFGLTAIPVIIGLCLKARPSIWLLALLLLSWAGLLVLSAVARPASRKKKRPVYIQNKDLSMLPYLYLGIALILTLGYVLISSGAGYRPPETVDEARDAIIAAEEQIRYEKLGGAELDGLSRGDLTETHPLTYTENPVFTLKMQVAQPMYLRCFSGGNFEKGVWEEAAEGVYAGEYTGITEWLAKKGFYPWLQQDRIYRMSKNYDFAQVSVNNINGNSKYLYLPYEAAMTNDSMPDKADYRKDYGAFAKGFSGKREYTFKSFFPKFSDYDESGISQWLSEVKENSGWQSYGDAEAVYRRFVYDTYLYVSDEDADALGTSGIDKYQGKSIGETLFYIRNNFMKEFEYDTQQEKAPKGQDELRYFMNKSYRGNDMHFATAAALMFRQAGIPARYAEGYYLSPDYVSLYTGQSDVSIDVPDSLSHSWVEIYIDELGWFPVEVIPGFFDMEKQENIGQQEDETIEEETTKNYQDEAPQEDEPENRNEEEEKPVSIWWLLLPALILLAALYELVGRYRIRKQLASFGAVYTDEQVFVIYRYVSRVMAFDGHPLSEDPYDKLEEISKAYDQATEMPFHAFLGLVEKVRFGCESLTKEEHKQLARYGIQTGKHIYQSQSSGKKFLMKFIFFCVS